MRISKAIPQKTLGIKSDVINLYGPGNEIIGYFTPIENYRFKYSLKLIKFLGLKK